MKILGTETRRNGDNTFSLSIVDNLDYIYSVFVKKGFWNFGNKYKKHIYTNGLVETISSIGENKLCKLRFKVINGDWLIISNYDNDITMYISEQYIGSINVKNKKIKKVLDFCYTNCRERIQSKRKFAKEMGEISKEINLPFQIVMALKGNKELLNQMVKNIEDAIKDKKYEDDNLMQKLVSKNIEILDEVIEIFVSEKLPSYQIEKIANYILECLVNKKIVRRYE